MNNDPHDDVFAVIMAGGSGTRFWPLSRKRRPKQLLPLISDGVSLLEESVARALWTHRSRAGVRRDIGATR